MCNRLKKIENWVILLKTWPKIGPVGIWMGHFSWKYGMWVYFQILWQHIPTKLEYGGGGVY